MKKTNPAEYAKQVIELTITEGSKKDGANEDWRGRTSLYHLVKGASHLALHIKYIFDPRKKGKENHLYKAITRLAMALTIENDEL